MIDEKYVARFWSKVNKDGPTPTHRPELGKCWVWTAGKFWCGYGCYTTNKKTYYAHRFSYTLSKGEIKNGVQVLHKCDNRACVNPAHFFTGTNMDNVDDKVFKKRQSKGKAHGDAVRAAQPRGENAPTTKLTEQQVIEIRQAYQPRKHGSGPRALGLRYGVKPQTIQAIIARKTWVHI